MRSYELMPMVCQYKERVNYLYDMCLKNGLEVDRQNKNPSRLSFAWVMRMEISSLL